MSSFHNGISSFIAPIVMFLALGEALLSAWHLFDSNGWGFTGTFINSGPMECFLAVGREETPFIYSNGKQTFLYYDLIPE